MYFNPSQSKAISHKDGPMLVLAGPGSGKTLVITAEMDELVIKSARNIPGVFTTIASILNPYMVLNNTMLVVDKAALEKIEEVYA